MSGQKPLRERFVELMVGKKITVSKRNLMIDLAWDGGFGAVTYLLTESPAYSIAWTMGLATDNILQYKTGYHVYNIISRGIHRLYNGRK